MKKRKISISFAKNYEDVYEFLVKKPNISQFICEVVRDKMFEDQDSLLEIQIEEILCKLIEEKGFSIPNTPSKSLNTVDAIDTLKNEDKDLIDSLF